MDMELYMVERCWELLDNRIQQQEHNDTGVQCHMDATTLALELASLEV